LNKSPWHSGFWRNVRQIRFRIGGGITELDYHGNNGNSYFFFYNSQQYEVSKVHFNDIVLEFTVNEKETCWYILPETDGVLGFSDGHLEYAVERFVLLNQDFHITDELSDHDGNMVLAPQPGTVLDIKVAEGQKVNRGDDLLIIESMKLENTILAARAGLIKKINIKTGDRVKKNEPLIYLQETINN
jgi:biotin carboxyl carrier protein